MQQSRDRARDDFAGLVVVPSVAVASVGEAQRHEAVHDAMHGDVHVWLAGEPHLVELLKTAAPDIGPDWVLLIPPDLGHAMSHHVHLLCIQGLASAPEIALLHG